MHQMFARVFPLSALILLLSVLVTPPSLAQQSCAEIDAVILQCSPDGRITGEPPTCFCEGSPVDPLELTCERNFGCADAQHVGEGEWPQCSCREVTDVTEPDPGETFGTGTDGTPPVGPITDMGGSHTCEQFFTCPSGAEMEVNGGQCTCTLVMLPQFNE